MVDTAEREVQVTVNQSQLKELRRLWAFFPFLLEENVYDQMFRIKGHFFKTWRANIGLKSGSLGNPYSIMGRTQFYVNRKRPILRALSLRVVSYSGVARKHEEGGEIRPKSGQYLRIPIWSALRKSGKARKPFQWYPESRRKSIDEMRNVIFKRAGSSLIAYRVVKRKGMENRLRPLFRMVESVSLKPRLNFFRTWTEMEGYNSARMDDAVEATIEGRKLKGPRVQGRPGKRQKRG